jgi:hypothetical protein
VFASPPELTQADRVERATHRRLKGWKRSPNDGTPLCTGRNQTVKITINVDCTAAEAREFFGLPDLRPLQAAWLAEVEKRLVADMQKFSPEGIARSWLSGVGAEWLPNMFGALAGQVQPAEKDKKQSG